MQSIKTANKVPTKDKVQIKQPPRIKIQKHTKQETGGTRGEMGGTTDQQEHQGAWNTRDITPTETEADRINEQTNNRGKTKTICTDTNDKTRNR